MVGIVRRRHPRLRGGEESDLLVCMIVMVVGLVPAPNADLLLVTSAMIIAHHTVTQRLRAENGMIRAVEASDG